MTCYIMFVVFSYVKRPVRDADPSPFLVPRSKKQSRAIPILSLRAFVACKEGEIYLLLCPADIAGGVTLVGYACNETNLNFQFIQSLYLYMFRAC
jgi:hypothetical protein